jgi:hypothetical protein
MRSTFSIRRPSASMVVALVALFAALGGTGYAAATINGSEIQKRSIPANRMVPNSLGSNQINESKLGTVPLSAMAQLATRAQSADSATSAVNAQSAASAQDAQKLQGRDATAFLANSVRVVSTQVTVPTGNGATITVSCAANEKGIGGGAAWIIPGSESPTELDAQLTASFPVPTTGGTDNMTGWRAAGRNATGVDRNLRAYAICVPKTA